MTDLLTSIPLVFAAKAAAPAAGGEGFNPTFLLYVGVIVLWGYFLLFRPQQKQERRRKEMLGALKKNDKVLTSAGIYGTVISIDNDNDKVVLRVDDDKGLKLAFSRASIVRVIDPSQEKEKAEIA